MSRHPHTGPLLAAPEVTTNADDQRETELLGGWVSCAELLYLVAAHQIAALRLGGETLISLAGVDAYVARHGADHATPVRQEDGVGR